MRKQKGEPGMDSNPKTAAESFPLTCYDNRELSWLKFNLRCLEEAMDGKNVPLGERLSFLSIFQSNLDEFYMVRCGALYDQRHSSQPENKTQMTAREQLDAILVKTAELLRLRDETWRALRRDLREQGVELPHIRELTGREKRDMEAYFAKEVQPLLSPQIISPRRPFPFLQNKEIYLFVSLISKNTKRFGLVQCSVSQLPRLIRLGKDSGRYLLLEELIAHFAPRLFDRYRIGCSALVRVVRNADLSIETMLDESDEADNDYRHKMKDMLKQRRKLCPIKLEYTGEMDEETLDALCGYLPLSRKQVFRSDSPLEMSVTGQLQDLLRGNRSLFYARRVPQNSPMIDSERPMIAQIEKRDVLLFYPYESMRPMLRLLAEAAKDRRVASIRMTLYRVAKNSQIVEALCHAAENGKEVTVLVELRARFDEENNIGWSNVLEDSGCRVFYGLDGYKTHSKLCLITYRDAGETKYITQIGTGNNNESTARLYTDLSLMTASRSIGQEAAQVFNALSMGQFVTGCKQLLVAPLELQSGVCELIRAEAAKARAGRRAEIALKLNSLTDKVVIDELIRAGQAGVKIRMLIRGICCLVPGITGYTENITVHSIVGRYLEHARIYMFGASGEGRKIYISSADFMTRNTTRRVEVAVQILDSAVQARLVDIFETSFADNVKTRVMLPDGTYSRVSPAAGEEPLNSREDFFNRAYAARPPEEERRSWLWRLLHPARRAQ